MYHDIMTYCEDTKALVQEVKEKHPDKIYIDEETGDAHFTITKTPTKRNGNKTLTLCRVTDEELAILNDLNSLTVLGTYDEIFADPDKLALYKSVWEYIVYIYVCFV